MNDFQIELRKLAFENMPEPIASVGDIVETIWSDWKKPHNVKICEIGIELVDLNTRARLKNETIREWLENAELIGVDLYYLALRLNRDGTARDKIGSEIVLSNFITPCGKQWQRKYKGFNHCGLSWAASTLGQD